MKAPSHTSCAGCRTRAAVDDMMKYSWVTHGNPDALRLSQEQFDEVVQHADRLVMSVTTALLTKKPLTSGAESELRRAGTEGVRLHEVLWPLFFRRRIEGYVATQLTASEIAAANDKGWDSTEIVKALSRRFDELAGAENMKQLRESPMLAASFDAVDTRWSSFFDAVMQGIGLRPSAYADDAGGPIADFIPQGFESAPVPVGYTLVPCKNCGHVEMRHKPGLLRSKCEDCRCAAFGFPGSAAEAKTFLERLRLRNERLGAR